MIKNNVQIRRLIWIPIWPLIGASLASGADWITAPSTYTHDPETGQRVDQYTPIGPVYTFARQDYLRSGYRHTRSALRAGGGADFMHIIEEWGRPVRPYGEWQHPYRPFSVPYSMWGPPFAGLGFPIPPYPYPYPPPVWPPGGPGYPQSPPHPAPPGEAPAGNGMPGQ